MSVCECECVCECVCWGGADLEIKSPRNLAFEPYKSNVIC